MITRTTLSLAFTTLLLFSNSYAGIQLNATDKTTECNHDGHDHEGHNHEGHDHEGHNHEEHDHEGHDHEEHNHEEHDHEGHNHEEHDHEGHDHDETSHHDDEGILYSKKQQQQALLQMEKVQRRSLLESVTAFATIEIPNNAQYLLSAPVSGILTSSDNIYIGAPVTAQSNVAYITPLLGQKEDLSTLKFELKKAQTSLKLTQQELNRLKQLKKDNAISQKRFNIAQQEHAIAEARLSTIKQRLAQLDTGSNTSLGITLKSPLDGIIMKQSALSGSFVNEGNPIVHIVNTSRVWININIAQSDMMKITKPLGVELIIDGENLHFTTQNNADFIYFSDMIDPKTRTASLVFEIDNTKGHLKAGARFATKTYTGKRIKALAISQSAIVNDNGQHVVYVQIDDERFERRNIKTGLHDAGYIEVHSGVNEGETVVSKGAYDLLLAALMPADVGHGHSH